MVEFVIDDETKMDKINPNGLYKTGMYTAPRPVGYGNVPGASVFPQGRTIPRSEWQARIKEMEERKSRLSDILTAGGVKVKNQQQTNYCWAFGTVTAVEILRAVQGQPYVSLSPASIAAPIKKYQNVGGWGEEALRYTIDNGIVSSELWPDTAIDKTHDNAASRLQRKFYGADEWWDLMPKSVDQMVTCLLERKPVPVGFDWWGHLVCAVDPVWLNNAIAIRIMNSWGLGWGSKGFGILQGNRMIPGDAVCPRTVLAS